jgi:two-component system KDP operon response regulator KdpE
MKITVNHQQSILLVDDNPHILELNHEVFSEEGYQLTKVTSGEAAIEALENKHFDMVITDITMGKVNGLKVLKRAKELHPRIKVIVTTGNTDIHYAIEALRLHADDYILKPFRVYSLVEKVADCFTQYGNNKKTNCPECGVSCN